MWTRNQDLVVAWNDLGYACAVSTHTQHMFESLLWEDDFVDDLLATNASKLGAAAAELRTALRGAGIPFVDPEAGLFFWIDLRGMLAEPTFEAERQLWHALAYDKGVILTPGFFCKASEPGWFRLCFAWMPDHQCLPEAVRRIHSLKNVEGQ